MKNIEWLKEAKRDYLREEINSIRSNTVSRINIKINDIIDELDEPETLTPEWINERIHYSTDQDTFGNIVRIETVPAKYLRNLLVPKQELPVIPKFVAEWYEEKDDIEREIYWECIAHQKRVSSYEPSETDKFGEWFTDTDNRPIETLINMKYGYTVEEEQKYIIRIAERDFMVMDDDGVMSPVDVNIHSYKYRFTEQEIKDYDERYWAFAVEVKELEE